MFTDLISPLRRSLKTAGCKVLLSSLITDFASVLYKVLQSKCAGRDSTMKPFDLFFIKIPQMMAIYYSNSERYAWYSQ